MTQCFAIFEGGGAKGLAHVGALKAAESRNLEFIGVAGASAGAIIAALVAAGFKADDLFCPDPARRANSLFAALDWIALLEKERWHAFQELRRELASLPPSKGSFGIRTALRVWSFKKKWLDFLTKSAERKGVFSTNAFETWLNDKLAERLKLKGGDVTFSTLYKGSGKILKIVAVDIVEQELVTYSHLNYAHLSVAKAVAASISIPLLFAPTKIGTRSMVDGGSMSNFPAWLFEVERVEYPAFTRTYGFTLVDAVPGGLRGSGLFDSIIDYAGMVARVGVFGGQTLLNEAIEYFRVVPIKTSFGVLDFQLDDEQKKALYEDGLQSASNYFREHGVADDTAVTIALKVLSDELRTLADLPLKGLRANIALPVSTEFLRVTYTHNMASDADDRLRLQKGQTGTGDVLSQRKPVLTDIRQIRKGRTMRGLNKYDAALVREDLISLISVPIFEADHDWRKPGM